MHLRRTAISSATVSPLPTLDDAIIPGWRLANRAVSVALGICAVAVVIGIGVAVSATVKITLDADGMLEPLAVWPVRSLESGIISSVLVGQGDTVTAGQPIALLDSAAVISEIAQLQAETRATQSDMERLIAGRPVDAQRFSAMSDEADARVLGARSKLRERMADVRVSGDPDSIAHASSKRTHVILDEASADLLAAQAGARTARTQAAAASLVTYDVGRKRAELQGLQAKLASAILRKRRLTIVAPATGVVLTEQTSTLVGAPLNAGESIIELGALVGWRAVVSVSSQSVHRVHPGDRARVRVPALSMLANDRFDGHVTIVASQASSPAGQGTGGLTPSTDAYRVVIELDAPVVGQLSPNILRRGYPVQAKIVERSGHPFVLLRDYVREHVISTLR